MESAAFHASEAINGMILMIHDVRVCILFELDVPFLYDLAFTSDIESQFIVYLLERHFFFYCDDSSHKRWINRPQLCSQKRLKIA